MLAKPGSCPDALTMPETRLCAPCNPGIADVTSRCAEFLQATLNAADIIAVPAAGD